MSQSIAEILWNLVTQISSVPLTSGEELPIHVKESSISEATAQIEELHVKAFLAGAVFAGQPEEDVAILAKAYREYRKKLKENK